MSLTYTPSVTTNGGWTPMVPHANTKVAYVTTDGNDATGAFVDASGITDPENPTSGENPTPYATLTAAYADARDGQADWILLKRGDNWSISSTVVILSKSGLDASNPLVISSYGPTNLARPKFTLANSNFRTLNTTNSDVSIEDIRISSIEFDGQGSTGLTAQEVINALIGGSTTRTFSNWLIEDCFFNRCGDFVIQIQNNSGFRRNYGHKIRRNVIYDSYQGSIYITAYDDILIEENIDVRSGYRTDIAFPAVAQGAQCWYLQDTDKHTEGTSPVTCRGNIITHCATSAIQARGGGDLDFNVFVKCPINIDPHGDSPFTDYDDTGQIVGNLLLEGSDRPGGDGPSGGDGRRGWGISVGNCKGTVVEDNILASCIATGNQFALAIGEAEAERAPYTCSFSRNVVYNWPRWTINDHSGRMTATFENNVHWDPSESNWSGNLIRFRPSNEGDIDNYTFSGNKWWSAAPQSDWYDDASSVTDFASWVTFSGTNDTVSSTDPWSKEADATLDGYRGSADSQDAWESALIAQRRGNWDNALMAVPIINWFRDGFGLVDIVDNSDGTVGNAAPAWQTIPRQSVAEGATATIDLSGYVSDADADTITLSEVGTWPTWASLSGTVVTLTPEVGDASGTNYTFDVRATDDGDPIRTADATITVTVTEEAGVDPPSGEANPSVLYSGVISFVIFGGKG